MEYLHQLQKDKKLAKVLLEPLPLLQMRQNIPLRLMASIMSQQLNTKVAKIIYKRFLEIYQGCEPEPKQVVETPFEMLRAIGLSNAKVNYVRNVAAFCIENQITDTKLMSLTKEEIIDLLTQIKGVGKWTVEMLLMFTLGREDVFAVDDLGIQQAMIKIYKLSADDKKLLKEKMLKISSKWKPYRTYACMHLWNWKDMAVEL
ncbi:MAG: DNA-3-methyladenine glycosylase II [uncultured Segetibacter sp.]|uniref:DNA-3-methyladenine glycosylase II n=1 Tax=uncultured Segetibacter sp. TaxID=481133 RepID=A0A6J4SKX9_9BACT|nr:MAG: DNA-3-methyladenine glycosylase II [uncultured Segetibacter sp.]